MQAEGPLGTVSGAELLAVVLPELRGDVAE